MRYVYIENGEVLEGPCLLPESWRNISGLKFVEEPLLISFGWYPYRFVPYEGDMSQKVTTGVRSEITSNEYIEYQEVRDKTQQEIDDDNNSRWQNIRARRNLLLSECDWTQMGDVELSPEMNEKWKEYRKALRNITNVSNPDQVVWPDPPSMTPSVI